MHVMQNALMHTWTTTAFSSVHSAGATLPPQGSMNSQAASLEPKALQQNGAFAAEGKTAVPTCYLHWRLCTKCLNENAKGTQQTAGDVYQAPCNFLF